ncbi:hypothetical protein KUTeg_010863 [Tegillarca granosa]|uniref:Uncharacterized protein n=1 Tax=Tegillarca granosa TaxID=220873 RepID=A0ABQ9F281_TEGGR|nr:hypothetical protein KUTeg_010863 [Tegillarca granosa]
MKSLAESDNENLRERVAKVFKDDLGIANEISSSCSQTKRFDRSQFYSKKWKTIKKKQSNIRINQQFPESICQKRKRLFKFKRN